MSERVDDNGQRDLPIQADMAAASADQQDQDQCFKVLENVYGGTIQGEPGELGTPVKEFYRLPLKHKNQIVISMKAASDAEILLYDEEREREEDQGTAVTALSLCLAKWAVGTYTAEDKPTLAHGQYRRFYVELDAMNMTLGRGGPDTDTPFAWRRNMETNVKPIKYFALQFEQPQSFVYFHILNQKREEDTVTKKVREQLQRGDEVGEVDVEYELASAANLDKTVNALTLDK